MITNLAISLVITTLGEYAQEIRRCSLDCFSLRGIHGPDPHLFFTARNSRAGPSSASRWEECTGQTFVCFSLRGTHRPDPHLFLTARNSRARPSSVSHCEELTDQTLVCFSLRGTHEPDPHLFLAARNSQARPSSVPNFSCFTYYAFTQYMNTQGRLNTSKI